MAVGENCHQGGVPVKEDKARGAGAAAHEGVDTVDDLMGHGEVRPLVAVEKAARGKTKEIIATLLIARWTESNGTGGATLWTYVQLKLAVQMVVDGRARNQCARAHCRGDAVRRRETI
jgi:hypothetical protein